MATIFHPNSSLHGLHVDIANYQHCSHHNYRRAICIAGVLREASKPLILSTWSLITFAFSCYENGSLSLINMPISRHTQNIMHSPTHSASISVWSNPPSANRARVALMGNVTFLDTKLAIETGIQDCYLQQHPDAQWWLPGDPDAAHIVRSA